MCPDKDGKGFKDLGFLMLQLSQSKDEHFEKAKIDLLNYLELQNKKSGDMLAILSLAFGAISANTAYEAETIADAVIDGDLDPWIIGENALESINLQSEFKIALNKCTEILSQETTNKSLTKDALAKFDILYDLAKNSFHLFASEYIQEELSNLNA